jgi:hypothetical protein
MADRAEIRCLDIRAIVARDHPAPERVRRRLEETARGPLVAALEGMLAPLGQLRSDEVLVIRRLELALELDASRDPGELARRWAAKLVAQLLAQLSPSAHGVVRFADEPALVAHWLAGLAGGGERRWYLRRFDGVAALPAPAAARTVLLDDPVRGLAALAALEPAAAARVARMLDEPECERVLRTLAAHPGAAPPQDDVIVALDVAAGQADAIGVPNPAWQRALTCLALAARRVPADRRPALAQVATANAAHAREPGDERLPEPGEAMPLHDAPGATAAARTPRAPSPTDAPAGQRGEAARGLLATRLGGLLLLLPHLPDGWLAEALPEPVTRAAGRLFVLARCAGAFQEREALADPVLRLVCGVEGKHPARDDWLGLLPPPLETGTPIALRCAAAVAKARFVVEIDEALDWASLRLLRPDERLTPARLGAMRRASRELRHFHDAPPGAGELAITLLAQRTLRAFARRLPGFARCSIPFLWTSFLAFPAVLEPRRLACRTGRPPLGALLDLTGALRGSIRAPWLPAPIDLVRELA